MPKIKNIYQRGHFFQQMGGAHVSTPHEMIADRSFFGLDRSASFAYGNLKADDGEMYEVCRRFSHHKVNANAPLDDMALPPVLLLFQTTELDGKDLRYDMATMTGQAATNDAQIFMDGDKGVWRSAENIAVPGFELTYEKETFTWQEEGLFSISGTIMPPGLQWYLPGRDYGTFYVSQIFQVTGQVRGKPVKGIIAYDQSYMSEGADLYIKKDLVMENQGHLIWYTWGTVYDDGTWENGHFMLGNGPLGFALFTDGNTITTTRDITGRVLPKEGTPFVDGIELTIDGEAWEFIPEAKGMMPDMLRKHPPTPQQEGRWQRVGETRKPVIWFAWGETEPDHGRIPSDYLPTEKVI